MTAGTRSTLRHVALFDFLAFDILSPKLRNTRSLFLFKMVHQAFLLFVLQLALSIRSQETRIYPDPANAPFTFQSDSKPYFALNATPIFNRVVNARIFHNGFWVLKDRYAITKVKNSGADPTHKL